MTSLECLAVVIVECIYGSTPKNCNKFFFSSDFNNIRCNNKMIYKSTKSGHAKVFF